MNCWTLHLDIVVFFFFLKIMEYNGKCEVIYHNLSIITKSIGSHSLIGCLFVALGIDN